MARPSDEQWTKLLNLISADKELLHGQFLGPGGVQRTRLKWEAIAEILNSLPGGVVKDGEHWRLTWAGLRSRARTSLRNMAAYRNGTGGGPDVDVAGLGISELYQRVLNLTGITAAVGSRCPCPLKIQLEMQNTQQQAAPLGQLHNVPDADLLLNEFIQGNIPNNADLPLEFEFGVGEAEIHDNAWDDEVDKWEEEEADSLSLDIPVNVKTEQKLQIAQHNKFEKDSSPIVINVSVTPASAVADHVLKGQLRHTLKLNLEVLLQVMQSAFLLD